MSLNVNSLNSISKDAASALVAPLTLELRAMAHTSGWPENIVSSLTVDYNSDEGTLDIDYPEEYADEIDSLEYGEPSAIPNAVFRPFIIRAPQTVIDVLRTQSLGSLFVELGVV